MSEQQFNTAIDKIQSAKTENIYNGLRGISEHEITRLNTARSQAFDLAISIMKHAQFMSQFEEVKS